jgi:hypothetical protein
MSFKKFLKNVWGIIVIIAISCWVVFYIFFIFPFILLFNFLRRIVIRIKIRRRLRKNGIPKKTSKLLARKYTDEIKQFSSAIGIFRLIRDTGSFEKKNKRRRRKRRKRNEKKVLEKSQDEKTDN